MSKTQTLQRRFLCSKALLTVTSLASADFFAPNPHLANLFLLISLLLMSCAVHAHELGHQQVGSAANRSGFIHHLVGDPVHEQTQHSS